MKTNKKVIENSQMIRVIMLKITSYNNSCSGLKCTSRRYKFDNVIVSFSTPYLDLELLVLFINMQK